MWVRTHIYTPYTWNTRGENEAAENIKKPHSRETAFFNDGLNFLF